MWQEWNRTPCLSRIHRRQHFKRLHYEPGTVNNEGLPPLALTPPCRLRTQDYRVSVAVALPVQWKIKILGMRGISSVLTSRMFHKLSHVPRHSIQQWVAANMHQHFPPNNQYYRQTLKLLICCFIIFEDIAKKRLHQTKLFSRLLEGWEIQMATFHTFLWPYYPCNR